VIQDLPCIHGISTGNHDVILYALLEYINGRVSPGSPSPTPLPHRIFPSLQPSHAPHAFVRNALRLEVVASPEKPVAILGTAIKTGLPQNESRYEKV